MSSSFYFGGCIDGKSRAVINPGFYLNVPEKLQGYMFPLLSLNCSMLGGADLELPFVFAEFSETDEDGVPVPLVFKY